MSSNVDPSTLGLTPHDLSKITKKELARYMSILQGSYIELRRKYKKAKTTIQNNATSATQAKSVKDGLIPKPPGRRSRDFNIFEEMNKHHVKISKDTYNNMISYLHKAIAMSNVDMGQSCTRQDMVEVVKVVSFMKEEFPFIGEYKNAWPVTMLMSQYLANHHANSRAKAAHATTPAGAGGTGTTGPSVTPADDDTSTAGPSVTTPSSDPDSDISDIENI